MPFLRKETLLTKLRPDLRGGAVLNVLSGLFAEAAHVILSLWRYSHSQNAMTWHQQDDSNSNDPLWSCMIILQSDFDFRKNHWEKWEMVRRVVQFMATDIQGGLLNPQGLGSWLFQAGGSNGNTEALSLWLAASISFSCFKVLVYGCSASNVFELVSIVTSWLKTLLLSGLYTQTQLVCRQCSPRTRSRLEREC